MAAQAPTAHRRARQALAAVAFAVTCVIAGCDSGLPPAPPPSASATPTAPELTPAPGDRLSEADRPAIYRQVVQALVREKSAGVVYIEPYVAQGEQLDVTTGEQVPVELIPALALADHGRTYEAAEFRSVVGALEKGGAVQNEGVFVTLGPVEAGADGKAIVRGSVYRKVGDAAGYTFELARDAPAPGGWVVTNTSQDW